MMFFPDHIKLLLLYSTVLVAQTAFTRLHRVNETNRNAVRCVTFVIAGASKYEYTVK